MLDEVGLDLLGERLEERRVARAPLALLALQQERAHARAEAVLDREVREHVVHLRAKARERASRAERAREKPPLRERRARARASLDARASS